MMSERIRFHLDENVDPAIAYCQLGARSVGEMIRTLRLMYEVLTPDDMQNRVEYL